MKKKKAKLNIPDNTELQSMLFNLSPDPIVILQDWKFVYASPSFYSTFGVTEEMFEKGLAFSDFVPKEEVEFTQKRYIDRISGSKDLSEIFEFKALRPDGRKIELEAVSATIEYQSKPAILSIVRDVTTLQRTKERLKATVESAAAAEIERKKSEDLYQKLIELSPDPIVILQDYYLKYASPSFFTTFGYSQKDIDNGLKMTDVMKPKDAKETIARYEKRMDDEPLSPHYTARAIAKDGRILECATKAVKIQYEGEPAVLCFVRDVTDLSKTQDELTQTTMELEKQKLALQSKNEALKEILTQIENEKLQVKKQVASNVNNFLMPILSKLKLHANKKEMQYVDVLETNLKILTKELSLPLEKGFATLSPKQMEICNLIRVGLQNKEIAEMMGTSIRTVEVHRNTIRKKLGLTGTNTNLSTFLSQARSSND